MKNLHILEGNKIKNCLFRHLTGKRFYITQKFFIIAQIYKVSEMTLCYIQFSLIIFTLVEIKTGSFSSS